MNNLIVWLAILIGSVVLGLIKYYAANSKIERAARSRIFNFNEILNHIIAVFLGGALVYYFISIRYPTIIEGWTPQVIDLILIFAIMMCFSGWMIYFIGNITKGIEAILKKILS